MLGLQRFSGGLVAKLFKRATYSNSKGRTTVTATTAASPSSSTPAETEQTTNEAPKKKKSGLVAVAFESLQNEDKLDKTNNIDERIVNAKTVNGLLSVTESNTAISRKHALKIVSILADWSTMNRVNLSDFENDSRFLRLCRMLGRTVSKTVSSTNNTPKSRTGFGTDDLNMVLAVAGDDEAAKLIASISLQQMVKVMTTLAQKKRRSTPLLRSLAYNMSSSSEHLDMKQCSDVLYSMAVLNFQDSVLAAKVCADIHTNLPKHVEKSAVIGSILTSLGILKYRDLDMLEALTQWCLKNSDVSRPQDLSALLMTSSILNFKSGSIDDMNKKLVKSIVKEDFPKNVDWLNHVWALALLGIAQNQHIESVLSLEFQNGLSDTKNNIAPTSKMKLLNLNGYAELLMKDYKGSLLPVDSSVYQVPLMHSRSKKLLLGAMIDALKSLLPANNYVQCAVDSKMGFLIDAACVFDEKLNPLTFDKDHPNAKKIALMIIDYHDVCHGSHRSYTGITTLSFELLEKRGYKVIPVPYNEFSMSEKLLKRVQYLEGKFKSIISGK